jgi:hypothetical protein
MGFRRSIGIAIALIALATLLTSPHAEAKTIEATSRASGSFVTASFSFDGKTPADYAVFTEKGNLGVLTGQGVSQTKPDGKTCTLPDGSSGIELTLVEHAAVTRVQATGDLFFEHGNPDSLISCLSNNITGTYRAFHEVGTVDIVGGTGRFSGASGTEHFTVDGGIFVFPDSVGFFGFSSGTFTLRITTE